jgi:hypothetical protein
MLTRTREVFSSFWSIEYLKYGRLFQKYLSGPAKEEVAGECNKFHFKGCHNLYLSPNIIWVILSIRVRWVWHVARMDKKRKASRVLVGERVRKRRNGAWIHVPKNMDECGGVVNSVTNNRVP